MRDSDDLSAKGSPATACPIPAPPRDRSRSQVGRALFVYGTLMQGEVRHPLIARHARSRARPASVAGVLLDLGAYPGLVAGEGRVRGELVELDDPCEALAVLDEEEGFLGHGKAGSLYRRALARARTEGGVRIAWVYRYAGPREHARIIASGDWRVR